MLWQEVESQYHAEWEVVGDLSAMASLRGEPVTGVLIDTCGWVAVVDARINIDLALEQQLGPIEIKVTQSVLDELQGVEEKESRNMLLGLLNERSELVSGEGQHTDDELLNLAIANKWPVLTVDKHLKARLHDANASVIEVHGSKMLRFIE